MHGAENPTPSVIKFALGQIVATPGALDALARARQSASEYLARHVRGDWGDIGADDAALNNDAVVNEHDEMFRTRVLSAYRTNLGDRIWVISEADRSNTCILLPEEY